MVEMVPFSSEQVKATEENSPSPLCKYDLKDTYTCINVHNYICVFHFYGNL